MDTLSLQSIEISKLSQQTSKLLKVAISTNSTFRLPTQLSQSDRLAICSCWAAQSAIIRQLGLNGSTQHHEAIFTTFITGRLCQSFPASMNPFCFISDLNHLNNKNHVK